MEEIGRRGWGENEEEEEGEEEEGGVMVEVGTFLWADRDKKRIRVEERKRAG